MNRLGLKIFCLVASIVIWGVVAATSDVEQSIHLPLRITGLDPSLTVEGSVLPNKVLVKLQGRKWKMFKHKYLNSYLGEVLVNLADQPADATFSYELARSDVFSELDVVSITPPVRLRLHVDQVESRNLFVRLETDGTLPQGKAFLVAPSVFPDSVRVTGPRHLFEDGGVVPTVRVKLGQVKASQDFPLALISPSEFLKLERSEVSASFKVADIEDRTLTNISVIPLVDFGQLEVGVLPPVVDVMVRGVADSIRALNSSRFLVTLPVGSLPEGIYTLAGEVEYPPWVTLIVLNPPEFQVTVGNPASDAGPDTSAVLEIDPELSSGSDDLE